MTNLNSMIGTWQTAQKNNESFNIDLAVNHKDFTISFTGKTRGLVEMKGKVVEHDGHIDLIFDNQDKNHVGSGSYCAITDTLVLACDGTTTKFSKVHETA